MIRTLLILSLLFLNHCGKKDSASTADVEEQGQQIGDAMASVDESGGSGGTLALAPVEKGYEKMIARLDKATWIDSILDSKIISTANATTCGASTFGSCSSGVITRTFGGCTVGSATFSGTVGITWSTGSCSTSAQNDTITRVPAFTVTGRRGATLTVSKTGSIGQRLTRGSTISQWTFTNDGIRRVFANSSGTAILDFTNTTTSAITVIGTSRSNRVMSGGALRVTNNLSGVYCDYIPSLVTWNTATCNCPVSGSWSGSCSDGKTSSVTISGCGTGSVTVGSDTNDVTFDRCG